jgi:hypothetical protein
MTQETRLPHCTPSAFTGHNDLCDRDGTFCSADSSHAGPCKPHGEPAGLAVRYCTPENCADPRCSNYREPASVDMTPGWAFVVEASISVLQNPEASVEGIATARGELLRLARLADSLNKFARESRKAYEADKAHLTDEAPSQVRRQAELDLLRRIVKAGDAPTTR